MARRFLIGIAVIIGIFIIGGVALTRFAMPLMAWYLVPSDPFDAATLPPAPDYQSWTSWAVGEPGQTTSADLRPSGVSYAEMRDVAIFYVHPTSYWDNKSWVAAFDDEAATQKLQELFLKGQASAFTPFGQVYAPHYRQAALGAFLARDDNTAKALSVAFSDVQRAFGSFLERIGPDTPFILAGHSQGALHALTLMHASMKSAAIQERLVAAYLIGWPIAPRADLPSWIAPCEGPGAARCVISWQTFGPDGDPSQIVEVFENTPSFNGVPKEGEAMLCTNPLSFSRTLDPIGASKNLGAVAITAKGRSLGAPVEALVGARCGDDGVLYLDGRPENGFDQLIAPGDNYHLQDIQLFYRNIQANVDAQIKAFSAEGVDTSR